MYLGRISFCLEVLTFHREVHFLCVVSSYISYVPKTSDCIDCPGLLFFSPNFLVSTKQPFYAFEMERANVIAMVKDNNFRLGEE